MAKRRKNNKFKQPKKPKGTSKDSKKLTTEWSPIDKPGDDLMPICTRCKKRPVSDARKGECGRCSISYKGHGYSFNSDVRRIERQFFGV